jgi:hypothetical protein
MDLAQLLRDLSEDTTQTDSSSVGSNIYNSGKSRPNAGNDSSVRSNSGTATRSEPSVGNVSGRSNTLGSGVGGAPASPSSVDSNSPSSGGAASSCDSNSRPAPRRQSWQCGSNCPHIACGNDDSTARRNNYPPNSGNDDCAESDRSPQAARPRYTNRASGISSPGRYSALPSASRQLACGPNCAHVFCGRFDRNARSRGPNSGPARSDSPASPVPGGSYSDAAFSTPPRPYSPTSTSPAASPGPFSAASWGASSQPSAGYVPGRSHSSAGSPHPDSPRYSPAPSPRYHPYSPRYCPAGSPEYRPGGGSPEYRPGGSPDYVPEGSPSHSHQGSSDYPPQGSTEDHHQGSSDYRPLGSADYWPDGTPEDPSQGSSPANSPRRIPEIRILGIPDYSPPR